MFNIFVEELHCICEHNTPPKNRNKKRPLPKWMSDEVMKKIKVKNKLWFKCKRSKFRNKNIVSSYIKARNACSKLIAKAVRKFEFKLAKESKYKPKLIYKYINEKRKIKVGLDAIKVDGQLITEHNIIADKINKYFKSIFSLENSEEIDFSKRTEAIFTLNPFLIFSPVKIEKYLKY